MGSSFPGGVNSLAYQGVRASNPVQNLVAQRAPTGNDLNYDIGTQWTDETNQISYVLVAISSGQAVWNTTGSASSGIHTITADSGSVTPASNTVSIIGGDTVQTSGSGSTLTINATQGGYPITPYVVGASGEAGYTTIQGALDAANAAGGGIIYVQPGTYTEDLTLYANTQIIGTIGLSLAADASSAVIVGVHTPPTTGTFGFRNAYLQSATDIFNSSAAGTALLSLGDCTVVVTNGYTFNIPNWSGPINVWDTNMDGGTNDGFINNTGGSLITAFECGLGQGTSNTATISGVAIIETSEINCPVNFVTGAVVDINWVEIDSTHTFSNNSLGLYNACKWSTGAAPAIVMSSSGDLAISNSTIRSSNSPAIDGAGAGTVELSEVTFLGSNNSVAATLTLGATAVTLSPEFRTLPASTASTLSASTWAAAGSNANIDMDLVPRGTGNAVSSTGLTASNGNVTITTAGTGLVIGEGSNARMGQATLNAGTVTVANTSVTANTRIFLTRADASTSTGIGALSVGTVTASTSFVINSLNSTASVETNDVSVVNYLLVEPA